MDVGWRMFCPCKFQIYTAVQTQLKVWLQSRADVLIEPLKAEFMRNVLCHKLKQDAMIQCCSHVLSPQCTYYCVWGESIIQMNSELGWRASRHLPQGGRACQHRFHFANAKHSPD